MANEEPITGLTAEQRSLRSWYERIIDRYLKECFRERTPARASEISNRLSKNRQHVSEVVRRLFGKPLKVVLREKQLAQALKLLERSALSGPQIAAAAAFGDNTTFHRAFKSAFGTTPDQYRREKRAVR
jgi:AraC-like DNA-binding protein